ncbi:zinc finger CCCH domain-containing protein 11A-like isoform X1 [Biomphalaria glabrata]|uniref:Zinc finger CCCH domain-containing protein 11A-like isoform X1 n=1 Tax=Biomphalaria glabrata TaxID=6526 RepID=A0A9W3BNU9_BIOGL|nr:zinc finger CCCH domain-containing protein 11A-like isoform X1 [Biomphalaria glabrata]XP_055901250.1 zinc finger CCCH domain-containing protein 11A-like isoform X1 [Biomphalaria glabrata]XP_055901251.1 zinc finger CCCH domain-containing protein 11A-like isoform X1 [Biomphalaria glabrata]KAI8784140.1 flocculation protein FLO11 isoform X1 [Biomphalaria glabrata]
MSSLGDDCYFFCTSSCAKGSACPFRHVESAKTAKIICQHWQMGNCLRPMCKFRHSDFKLQIDLSETPCYWESQPSGCLKLNCSYKHSKPRPTTVITGSSNDNVLAAVSNSGNSESATTPATPASTSKPEVLEKNNVVKQPDTATVEVKTTIEGSTDNLDCETPKKATPIESPVKVKPVVHKKMKKKKTEVSAPKENLEPAKVKKLKKKSHLSVKDRLGAPTQAVLANQSSTSTDSSSDSEDSIENIKVMSMEEIFRQKALESMMKKRAEGKIPEPTNSSTPIVEKKVSSPIDAPSSSTSEESAATSSSNEVEEESEESESSDGDSSSSAESSDSEQDSGENFEPDVRRVVVEIETEDLSKKREKLKKEKIPMKKKKSDPVKISFLETKQRQRTVERVKRKVTDEDYDSDDLVSSRVKQPLVLNVHDRLGKSQTLSGSQAKSKSYQTGLLSLSKSKKPQPGLVSLSKRVVSVDKEVQRKPVKVKAPKLVLDKEADPLAEVKVKTLEEIKQEKMRKLAAEQQKETSSMKPSPIETSSLKPSPTETSSLKQSPTETSDNIKEANKKRKVLLSEDIPTDEVVSSKANTNMKRLKKFAQKNKKLLPLDSSLPAPERNVVTSPVQAPSEIKIAQRDTVVPGEEEKVLVSRKHKHKHKERNLKKPKTERQIYIPPAMKNSMSAEKSLEVKAKETETALVPLSAPRKERHPIAAVWSAGLSLSAKGEQKLDASRISSLQPVVEKRDIKQRIGLAVAPMKTISPVKETKTVVKPSEQTDSTMVNIKSFSEIMSEKRRRRQEMQSQKNGTENTTLGQDRTKPYDSIETKPKPAFKPIVFDLDQNNSSGDMKTSQEPVSITSTSSQFNRLFDKKTSFQASKENESTISFSDFGELSHKVKLKSASHLSGKKEKLFKRKKSFEQAHTSTKSKLESCDSNLEPPSTTQHTTVSSVSRNVPSQMKDSKHGASSSHFHTQKPAITVALSTNTITVTPSGVKPSHQTGILSPTLDTFSTDTEPSKKKSRPSLEDEFNFFEDEGYDYNVTDDVEPIDDLLQNIDDLLS